MYNISRDTLRKSTKPSNGDFYHRNIVDGGYEYYTTIMNA